MLLMEVYLARTVSHHPAVEPAWSAAMQREVGQRHAHAHAHAQVEEAENAASPRRTRGSTPRTRRKTPGAEETAPHATLATLQAAARTPLPPSPPPEEEGPRRRSARLGSVQ